MIGRGGKACTLGLEPRSKKLRSGGSSISGVWFGDEQQEQCHREGLWTLVEHTA